MSHRTCWTGLGVFFAFCLSAFGQEPVNPLKVERVALFKNGLGYFTSRAELPEGVRQLELRHLPIPSHGTFWVAYEPGTPLTSVTTSMRDVTEKRPAQSIEQLMAGNIGKTVSVYLGTENQPPIKGKLVSVVRAEPPQPPSPYVMSARLSDPNRGHIYPHASAVAMIEPEGEGGTIAIHTQNIIGCYFGGGAVATEYPSTTREPVMRMELSAPAKGQSVWVSYLARGITWAPAYHIDISDEKAAMFSAQAVIVNEAADLENVPVELVTGFPNLRFADVPSPVAMSINLEQFMAALRGDASRERSGHGMVAQQAMVNYAFYDETVGADPAYSTIQEGRSTEDLFLYPVESLTLKRGETAMLPLFTAQMPYKHIYTWDIPDTIHDQGQEHRMYPGQPGNPPHQEEVWHACRLTNTAKMPLTTAPAQFIKDGQIVGQDICRFTNPGQEATIRINRAMKVVADQAEYEEARQDNAVQLFGDSYAKVTVRGELKLRSAFDQPVAVEITKLLAGDVVEADGEPRVDAVAKGLKAVNTNRKLTWKFELEGGAEKIIGYTYTLLIRQ